MLKDPVFVYVEDDPLSQEVMAMLLQSLQVAQFTIFADSTNFLERIEALSPKPNFFFLDVHVQPHSGFDMLSMLRSHPDFQGAIVVALTASVMSDEVQRLKTAGFDGIIPKPIDVDRFPAILETLKRGDRVWRIVG